MPMQDDLRTFILKNNLAENATKEELQTIKEAYRKEYLKKYHQQYRKDNIRVELYLKRDQLKIIKSAASKYEQKRLGSFIRECCIAYLKQEFVLPSDSKIQDLIIQTRSWGNNLNQIAKRVNSSQFSSQDLANAKQVLKTLEAKITQTLSQPESIDQLVKEHIEKRPELQMRLQKILDSFDKG